jgi:hypothetical protein
VVLQTRAKTVHFSSSFESHNFPLTHYDFGCVCVDSVSEELFWSNYFSHVAAATALLNSDGTEQPIEDEHVEQRQLDLNEQVEVSEGIFALTAVELPTPVAVTVPAPLSFEHLHHTTQKPSSTPFLPLNPTSGTVPIIDPALLSQWMSSDQHDLQSVQHFLRSYDLFFVRFLRFFRLSCSHFFWSC